MGGAGGRVACHGRPNCLGLVTAAVVAASLVSGLLAQSAELGSLPIQRLAPEEFAGHVRVWGGAQDDRGFIHAATSGGLLQFDGVRWQRIRSDRDRHFFAVASVGDGTVLVGSDGDFGYLERHEGKERFISLANRLPRAQRSLGEVRNIVCGPEGAFFVTGQQVFRWRREAAGTAAELRAWSLPQSDRFCPFGFGYVAGRYLLHLVGIGLAELVGDEFVPIEGSEFFADRNVTGYGDLGGGALLVCAGRHGVFRFQDGRASPLSARVHDYAVKNRAAGCFQLGDDRFAISTEMGGVVIVNARGDLVRVLDRAMGLHNNKVNGPCFAGVDGGMWIPTDYGVARVQIGPLQRYDYQMGLDGGVREVVRHEGTLYVGTSAGLFALRDAAQPGRLARFERMVGLEGNCIDVLSLSDRLLVANKRELLQVRGGRGSVVVEEACRSLARSRRPHTVLAGTSSGRVLSLELPPGRRLTARTLWRQKVPIDHVVEAGDGAVWIAWSTRQGSARVARLVRSGDGGRDVTVGEYGVAQGLPPSRGLRPIVWHGRLFVCGREGVFEFDAEKDRFEHLVDAPQDVVVDGVLLPHIDSRDRLWFLGRHGRVARWDDPGARQVVYPLRSSQLDGFHSIWVENDGQTVWKGGYRGVLERHAIPSARASDHELSIFLRAASTGRGIDLLSASGDGAADVSHAHGSLRFDFAAPCFDQACVPLYQTRVVGWRDAWSDLSESGTVQLPQLASGSYRFEVRAQCPKFAPSRAAVFAFTVLPPWYATWWAWLLWVASTAALIRVIIHWAVRGSRRRISILHEAQEALRQSELRYRTLVESAPEAILVFDLDRNRFVDANDQALQLFGLPRPTLLTLTPADVSPLRQPDGESSAVAAARYIQEALSGGSCRFEWFHADSEGNELPCEIHLVRHAELGRQVRATIVDVSDRVRQQGERAKLEGQLLHSRKLEALGRLAGGVSHDFNNILTAMQGETDLLRTRLGSECSPEVSEHVDEIAKACTRAAELTGHLLAFSRKEARNPRLVDLNEVVRTMEPMLRRVIREDIGFQLHLGAKDSCVLTDTSPLEQAIVNLVVNARDAMPKGGAIVLETSNIAVDEEYAATHTEAALGRHVALTVRDTGEGIRDDVKPHIFEPFYTTKAAGVGTGLGLASVHGVVRQSGGHIVVASELGSGSAFHLVFPLTEGTPENMVEAVSTRRPEGDETVLVCDDNPVVLRSMTRILETHGYVVLSASGPEQAISISREFDETIHLLLSDVVMPVMNGREMAEQILRERRDIEVLFVSGYTSDVILRANQPNAPAVLDKPFTASALLQRVRETLDGSPAGAAKAAAVASK